MPPKEGLPNSSALQGLSPLPKEVASPDQAGLQNSVDSLTRLRCGSFLLLAEGPSALDCLLSATHWDAGIYLNTSRDFFPDRVSYLTPCHFPPLLY